MSIPESSGKLIESVQSAAAYNHPVDEFHVLETHISWVILTGQYAYKIKKPVDMGFLNFTTLDQRKFYCDEELRLNQRLAPQLYLGVVPITGSHPEPKVGGTGQPIEFAVRMRQFPQDMLLSQVLERGALTAAHIGSLARTLAEFHARVDVAPDSSEFGLPDTVRRTMQENLHDLGLDAKSELTVACLSDWCRTQFENVKDQMLRRKQAGFVRECHGDMHLGNMLLLDDQPVVFDCIEFNERFRWIDVLSEVAFTVMDLEDRGSSASGHRLVSAYLEQTGDYEGLAVFRYYLVFRALVRAKVARIRLGQEHIEASERGHLLAEYHGYLKLANRYTRFVQPTLAITHGPSGSGKSTVALALVEAMGAVRIRSDVERKRRFGLHPLDHSAASEIYSSAATADTYARLEELTRAILTAGQSVVVDAAFLSRRHRDQFRELADQLEARLVILDMQVTEEALFKRVAERSAAGKDVSDASVAVLRQQLATQEPLDPDELPSAVPVGSDYAEEAVSAVQSFLRDQRQSEG